MSQGQADYQSERNITGRPLPLEVGFLAAQGHSFEPLHYAAALAAIVGLTADEVLIKSDLVQEEEYYRALAQELHLPFLPRPDLSRQARYPESILSGVAPLTGTSARFVFAPRGQQVARLLQSRRSFGTILAITTPTALRLAVFRAQSLQIAYRAALQLPDRAPSLSSRDGGTTAQVALVTAACTALLLLGAPHPGPTVAVLTAALTPLFLAMVLLRLAAAFAPDVTALPDPAFRLPDAALPTYTVIVALYRERKILPRLVEALCALDYPTAKLDIKLVIEADDGDTAAALSRLHLPARFEVIVAPPGNPRTKPRALNVALPLARGEFTVVYDAEDVPDPDQLRLAVDFFARQPDEVACLQARLTIDNAADTCLTRLFAIEYASLFDVLNPGLAALGCPIPLGGTSNHFRTTILHRIMGWDAWNVTEDADLGIRLSRFGYRTADLPSWTKEEAPIALGGWMRQRTRWLKGFAQTCLTHSRQPRVVLRQLGPFRFAAAVTMTFGTVLSALVFPVFTVTSLMAVVAGLPASGDHILAAIWSLGSILLFVFGLAAIIIPALVGIARRRAWSLLPWVILLPPYYVLVSVAAWRSLWELAYHPFRWNKTEHGLARTTRSRAPRSWRGDPVRLPQAGG